MKHHDALHDKVPKSSSGNQIIHCAAKPKGFYCVVACVARRFGRACEGMHSHTVSAYKKCILFCKALCSIVTNVNAIYYHYDH